MKIRYMMMVGLLMAVICGEAKAVDYPPQSFDITNVSKMILPAVYPAYMSSTRTNSMTNAVNDYIRIYTNNQDKFYGCTVAGISSNVEPTWATTNDVVDGTTTWRYVNPRRNAITIVNNGTSLLFLSYAFQAVSGKGISLNSEGGAFSAGYVGIGVYQGEIYAISESGTNSVSIHEE